MQPYGERIPRVHWLENHGCSCCSTYRLLSKKNRKPSKVRARQRAKKVIQEAVND